MIARWEGEATGHRNIYAHTLGWERVVNLYGYIRPYIYIRIGRWWEPTINLHQGSSPVTLTPQELLHIYIYQYRLSVSVLHTFTGEEWCLRHGIHYGRPAARSSGVILRVLTNL
jgi:hypothetical protein